MARSGLINMVLPFSQKRNFAASCGKQVEIEQKVKTHMEDRQMSSLFSNYLILYAKKILKLNEAESILDLNKWALRDVLRGHLTRISEKITGRSIEQSWKRKPGELVLDHNFREVKTTIIEDPVGFWRFDEGSGSYAYDSSGNNNTGTLNFCTWQTGKFNKCLRFNGATSYVEMLHSPVYSGLAKLSLSCWFKTSATGSQMIMAKHNLGSDGEYFLQLLTPDKIRFTTINAAGVRVDHDVAFVYADGLWHHIICTYNGAAMEIIVDKVSYGTKPQTGTLKSVATANFRVGRYMGSGAVFNGDIDEVRIHNRVLSQTEINDLFEKNFIDVKTTEDLSGYNFDAVLEFPVGEKGLLGNGLYFNGVDDSAFVPYDPKLDTEIFSAGLWVKCDELPINDSVIMSNFKVGPKPAYLPYGWCIQITAAGEVTVGVYNGSYFAATSYVGQLIPGQWHQVFLIYDGLNAKSYFDGQFISEESGSRGYGANKIRFAYTPERQNFTGFFKGFIDEVRIYKKVLTSQEVFELYQAERI